jgi:hypothetical protein
MPKETKEYVYKVGVTLFNNELNYPLGHQTALALQANLPKIFKGVVEVDSLTPSQPVTVVLQPSIVDFKSNIPFPAYNPYTASIVYRIDVYNCKGEKIFSQTVTGDAQTSRGLVSGFMQNTIYAEAAQMAIDKAMQQIIEGLAYADELREVN